MPPQPQDPNETSKPALPVPEPVSSPAPEVKPKEEHALTTGVVIPIIEHSVVQKPVEPAPVKMPLPEVTQSGAAHVDLSKVLLPKKEIPGHTVNSAQRVNAAVLLEQEITAGLEGTKAQLSPEEKLAAVKPAPVVTPQKEVSTVQQLETFQRDIEKVVKDNNVSVLTIASAEAKRNEKNNPEEAAQSKEETKTKLRNAAFIAGGITLLLIASGAVAYFVNRAAPLPRTTAIEPNAPFIAIDDAKEITITQNETRDQILTSLNAARQATSLSLGLMSQLSITESSSTANGDVVRVLTAPEFFARIAPNFPDTLSRALKAPYILGVHVYDGEQAFIVASVYSYDQGYSGMLKWEPNMLRELSPLFKYTPRQHIPEEGIATSSAPANTQFIQSDFVDKIVENNDVRALVNDSGDIYLLWTFLDRNTLIITTNQATLREIISRLKNAPITPVPGQ
jgi:hypothetical protein